MLRRLLPLSVLLLAACSSDPTPSSDPADAAEDVDYGDGPITTRPDDGVDGNDASDGGADGDAASDGDPVTDADATPSDVATDTPPSDVAVDAGSPTAARIHEIYVDRAVEGDKVEYVEISAPPGTPLDSLWIRVIRGDGTVDLNLRVADTGTKMKASGFWVVGSVLASKVDKGYLVTEWGLPNDKGAVQLVKDGTTLVDVVAYGAATPPSPPATEPKKVVEGSPAMLPASGSTGKVIGRKSVPGDTDNNQVDFCVQASSPGAANGACL